MVSMADIHTRTQPTSRLRRNTINLSMSEVLVFCRFLLVNSSQQSHQISNSIKQGRHTESLLINWVFPVQPYFDSRYSYDDSHNLSTANPAICKLTSVGRYTDISKIYSDFPILKGSHAHTWFLIMTRQMKLVNAGSRTQRDNCYLYVVFFSVTRVVKILPAHVWCLDTLVHLQTKRNRW